MPGSQGNAGTQGSVGSPQQVSMELLTHFLAMDGPVRDLAWAPAELAGTTADSAHQHLFAVVGHGLHPRIWDLRHAHALLSGSLTTSNFKRYGMVL